MKTAVNLLLLLGLTLSLSAALMRGAFPPASGHDRLMDTLGLIWYFLVRVNIWPFLCLQLLLCCNVRNLWIMLLPLLACALLFAAGCAITIATPGAGGLMVMLLTLFYSCIPAMGGLLGLAVWAAARLLLGLPIDL